MAAQLNYGYSTPKGVAGGKANIVFDFVATRSNEEADGVLKYGMAVMVGTTPGASVKLPTNATADTIEGIVLRAANTEQDMSGTVVVKNGASVGVIKKGSVWGRTVSDCEPSYGETAYVVTSGDDVGLFTNKSAEGTTVDIGAKFGNAFDDGIAVIEI
jgi:hypothetical protein